ncbi:extracellular solute-binding protein [Kribbella sp. NPDC050124]|uniref:extracellular solute-binding protein n=1 Tax=Kribbella sp. NPDC050124 TaxID=3364114 RepID=UPI0037BC5FEE
MRSPKFVAAGAVATVLLVSACSGGGSSGDSGDTDSSTIELFASVATPVAGPPGEDYFWKKLVKDATGVDVKLNFVTEGSQYTPKLQARAAANDLPDLYYSDATTQSQLSSQGLAGDWTPLLDKMPTWVKEHEVDRFKPVGTFDGKLTGLTGRTGYPYKPVVVIRKDWLQKLNLSEPKTLDQYFEVMKAFTERDPDGNGKKDTYGWTGAIKADGSLFGFDPIFGAFDALGLWQQSGDSVEFVGTSDKYRDALAFIDKMNKAGVIDPDWKAQKPEDTAIKYQSGKVGLMQNDWCAALCAGNYSLFIKGNPKGVVEILDPPTGPGGASGSGTYSAAGMMLGISQQAIDAGKGENIAKVLEWMAGPGYIPTVFGEEGKTKGHVKEAGGQIRLNNANTDYASNLQLVAVGIKGTTEELKSRYGGASTTQGDGSSWSANEWLDTMSKYPKKDVTSFSALPPPPVESGADLTRVINEGAFKFASGTQPLSGWGDYVASVKKTGLDAWTQNAQSRLKEVGAVR